MEAKYKIQFKPLSEREVTIAQRLGNSTEVAEAIYDFRGDSYVPKVVSLPIDMPVYRMENCRTFSAQQSEIAKNGHDPEFFAKGQEKASAQQAQHEILAKLARKGTASVTPIIDVLDADGQREPILIAHSGVVVNGNRRLSAMRELYRSPDGGVDARFSHVKCAVLPFDATTDEIDDIEADLQARPQTKLDYDWIGDAQLIRRQIGKGRSSKEVADRLRRSKADIENSLQALDEADLYLSEWAGKPGRYEIVSEHGEQLFADIPKQISKKSTAIKNASRAIAWSLFDNRDKVSGRVYSYNAAFGRLAEEVVARLRTDFEIDEPTNEDETDDFDIEIDAAPDVSDNSDLVDFLKKSSVDDDAAEAVIEVYDTVLEIDRARKNADAALKLLSKANSNIIAVDANAAGQGTLKSMQEQIAAIRSNLDNIEEVIEKRLAADEEEEAANG